jgi:tetratricopeptide (TPR) repeat protein
MTDPTAAPTTAPTASRGTPLRERLRVPISAVQRTAVQAAAAPFVLRLRAHGDQLLISATGPAGSAEATSPLPTVEAVPREVAAGDTRPWKIACRTGEHLFAAAFPPPIAQLFEASLQRANDKPLPVVLQIDGDELVALPWELLRDPERERFLALSPRTPLSRATAHPRNVAGTPVERGNLRVSLLADGVEEAALAVTSAVGADARVDVGVNDHVTTGSRPHVLLVAERGATTPEVPPGTPLVVIAGNGAVPPGRVRGDRADLLVPGTMGEEARVTFATKLAGALADGRPLDAAVAVARRAVADAHSVVALDWAEPVLVAQVPSLPLVVPARSAAMAAGAEVAAKTVGWFRDALTGSLSAVLFLLAGLLVYRLGFSTSNSISLDLLSPYDLFSTFKGFILALSTQQDNTLLVVAGILLALTAIVGALWLRNRRIDPEEQPGLPARLAGPFTGVRALSFLAMATVTIAGAYAYQQYLWRVVLPIPKDALGIAITREAAAASIQDDLSGVLYTQGQTGRIVVRDLPVAFDAGDTAKARKLGKRIGAKAVLIYREIDRGDGGKQYGAYVVFTDPSAGLTIGAAPPPSPETGGNQTAPSGTSGDLVQVREGVEIPALRTDTVSELVSASAGVIAYNENRLREAITLFQQALPADPSAPNTGMINFYLGDALRLDHQDGAAEKALERSIAYYETRRTAAVPLSPQDELVLVKSYFTRGWLAADTEAEGLDKAIAWYGKALPLHDELLARSGQLDRPATVRAVFARIFTHLAEANRRLDRPADQQTWEQRAKDELDALAREAPPNDPSFLAQEAGSRFFIGDCTGAQTALQKIRALDPHDLDALIAIGTVAMFQNRPDQAAAAWQQVLTERPADAEARESLADLAAIRGLGDGPYFEPVYLQQSEDLRRAILAIDPANERAYNEIADSAGMRAAAALLDSTAQAQGDELTTDKSTVLWPQDPERRAAAESAWDVVIQQRRILATEIHPNDPSAEAALAEAYDSRQNVHYQGIPRDISKIDPNDPVFRADTEAILADAKEIKTWTDKILAADSGASRLDRLRAWRVVLNSTSREWAVAVARGDYQTATALVAERHRLFAGALADADAAPVSTTDEVTPLYAIYTEGYLLAWFDKDTKAQATYEGKLTAIATWLATHGKTVTRLDNTFCKEEGERISGDEARAKGDLPTARRHYEAALALNTEQVNALAGLAAVLVAHGDVDGATLDATKATTAWPGSPVGWTALVQARLAAGDAAGAGDALTRFLDVTASLPPQERMTHVRYTIEAIAALLKTHPDRTALAMTTVPTLTAALDGMPADYAKTYQYPQLYAQLGALALDADAPANAEPLLRRALALDPLQPAAQADLAQTVLAQQRDASAEIKAAIAVSQDPVWKTDPTDPTALPKQVLAAMSGRIDDYLARFPDRTETMRPLRDAIAAEVARLSTATGQ